MYENRQGERYQVSMLRLSEAEEAVFKEACYICAQQPAVFARMATMAFSKVINQPVLQRYAHKHSISPEDVILEAIRERLAELSEQEAIMNRIAALNRDYGSGGGQNRAMH